MKKVNLLMLAMAFLFFTSCSGCSGSKDNSDQTDQEQNSGSGEEEDDEMAHFTKENGIVKLQVDGKTFNWACLGTYTESFKSVQFNFLGLSDQFYEGSLPVEKTLMVEATLMLPSEQLEPGEYSAKIGYSNTSSEGFFYNSYADQPYNGTVVIKKVTKIDDFYLWVEGELICSELDVVKAEIANQSNVIKTKLKNIKLQINNRCQIYK